MTWALEPVPAPVAAGKVVSVTVTAMIAAGWHVYSLTQGPGGPTPMRISLPVGHAFALADSVKGSAPSTGFDSTFGINVETYDGRAAFAVPITVTATAATATDTLVVVARYQACNASTCLPTRIETMRAIVRVTAAKTAPKGGRSG